MLSKGFSNRRRSERASLLLPASVVTLAAYQFFELTNLSPNGAKLRGPELPPVGTPGLFRVDGFQTLCRVVWAKDELCGVQFEECLPPRILSHLRQSGSTKDILFSLDEQQAAEEWINGAGA